jgi:cytochrome c oxidase subunit IV
MNPREALVSEHIVSPKLYVVILLALLLGTFLTVDAAVHDFGPWNIVIALAIATGKATLVILFFMHARYIRGRTQIVIIAGFFWLAILLGLTLTDYTTRQPQPRMSYAQPPAHVLHV